MIKEHWEFGFFMNHPLLQRLKLKINDFLKKIQETFEILFNISLFLAYLLDNILPDLIVYVVAMCVPKSTNENFLQKNILKHGWDFWNLKYYVMENVTRRGNNVKKSKIGHLCQKYNMKYGSYFWQQQW